MPAAHKWIWQVSEWPHFSWDDGQVLPPLRQVRQSLGMLLGRAESTNESDNISVSLDAMLRNIIASSAIESEELNVGSVRSSLARRFGLSNKAHTPVTDHSEGLAEIFTDSLTRPDKALTRARLYRWHRWLFLGTQAPPRLGKLRGNTSMQVVSGRTDRPTVHFQAPPKDILQDELSTFIHWFNASRVEPKLDPLLRAAVTHLWFLTLHPFDDGNGRLARALTDLALAQAEPKGVRLYAMAPAILSRRKDYYDILERTQRGTLNITPWILWFLDALRLTLNEAMAQMDRTLLKARFWQRFREAELSKEQTKVLNRLLDGGQKGFLEGISASQYQRVAKVSKATATRHLADLLAKGCIEKLPGGGRSTRYVAVV